jgi:DNA-binding NarL/FixJ family response regulator
VCERLSQLLRSINGITIAGQAHNVLDAIDSINQLKPEVVLLDIQMPGGSGIDVLRNAKQQTPAPTVMMITNFPYPHFRKKCMEAGADYFFDKSTEFSKVFTVFSRLNEKRNYNFPN